jgi:hypothetical protein
LKGGERHPEKQIQVNCYVVAFWENTNAFWKNTNAFWENTHAIFQKGVRIFSNSLENLGVSGA